MTHQIFVGRPCDELEGIPIYFLHVIIMVSIINTEYCCFLILPIKRAQSPLFKNWEHGS